MPKVKLFNEQEVLEKAMSLFWKKGYHATSIQDLVSYLGISRSSIYDTYGGKKELFEKAFNLYRNINISGLKGFLASQNSVKKGLKDLFHMAINETINDHESKGCFVVNTTTELVPGDPKLLQILLENKATFEKIFFDFLTLGEKSGEIPKGKNLKSIATLLYTFYNGIKVVSKSKPDSDDLKKSVITLMVLLD